MKAAPGSKPRSQLVLDAICQFQEKHGRSPSHGEIAGIVRISRSSVQSMLKKLLRDGCIKREKFSHTIVVVSRKARVYVQSAEERSKQNTVSGRKGRGQDIRSPKPNKSLDARIEMVVRMAREKEQDHSTDVIRGFHHVANSSLKASRVG